MLNKDTEEIKLQKKNAALVETNKAIASIIFLNYSEAFKHYKLAAELDPENSQYLHNVGKVCWQFGKYIEAHERYFKGVAVYDFQSKYEEALEYHFKAFNIRKKVLGTEHPNIADSYNNISVVYHFQGKQKKALEYCLKALKIREEILGVDHLHTIASKKAVKVIKDGGGDFHFIELFVR